MCVCVHCTHTMESRGICLAPEGDSNKVVYKQMLNKDTQYAPPSPPTPLQANPFTSCLQEEKAALPDRVYQVGWIIDFFCWIKECIAARDKDQASCVFSGPNVCLHVFRGEEVQRRHTNIKLFSSKEKKLSLGGFVRPTLFRRNPAASPARSGHFTV